MRRIGLVILLLMVSDSLAAAQSYFYNRANFATGTDPSGVTIADFNGNGRNDLAITNRNDNTVSILLGKPDGTFGAKTDFPAGDGPTAVVAGDFNGDGKVDLAVVDFYGVSEVSILLGNGDGTFQAPVSYATGPYPVNVAVGDFNGDGKLDLAVAYSEGVSVLLGNGDGTFKPMTDYATPLGAGSVIVADFNGDGKPDLAVACTSNNFSANYVSVLLGNGDGTFQPHVDYPTGYATTSVAAADFNGDGKLDLVVESGDMSGPQLLLGNGDGTFQPATYASKTQPNGAGMDYQVLAGDFNHDGKMDFVVANVYVNGIRVYLGNGDGTFQPEQDYFAQAGQGAMALGDVNGDGAPDIAIAIIPTGSIPNLYPNTVTVLLNNGDGTFSPGRPLPPLQTDTSLYWYAVGASIGDFTGDGKPDLLVPLATTQNVTIGAISVLPGKGDGTFGAPIITNTGGATTPFCVADFNGDGKPDLAIANLTGLQIFLGNGDGTFTLASQIPTYSIIGTSYIAVAGDFNGDGKPDLILMTQGQPPAGTSSPLFYFFAGNGDGTFQNPTQFSWSGSQWLVAAVAGDFNHDGKLDLAVALSTGLAVMLGKGNGTFQPPVIYPTDNQVWAITTADLNGDGIPDLVVTADKADVYIGNGDGTFRSPVYYDAGQFPREVVAGDFNGDGKVDLAVNDALYLSLLLGKGDGTFQPPASFIGGDGHLAAGRLTQDPEDALVRTYGPSGSLYFPSPILSVFPNAINFGQQEVNTTSAPATVMLTNVGNRPTAAPAFATSGPFSVGNGCGAKMNPAADCSFDVTFQPVQSGPQTGYAALTDEAPSSPQVIALSGTGVTLPDFSLGVASGSSSSETVSPGGTATYSLSVTPHYGFNGAVALACSGVPAGAKCSVSPASVTVSGSSASTATVTVTTTAPALALPTDDHKGPLDLILGLIALFALGIGEVTLRRRGWHQGWMTAFSGTTGVRLRRVMLAGLFLSLLAFAACGGGSGSSGGSNSNQGITAGTYTLSVKGTSGNLSHSETLTLNVN